jgi:hypothetical protein
MTLIRRLFVLFAFSATIAFLSCGDDENKKPATCSNGIMDGTETDVDCGGACNACVEPQPSDGAYIKFKSNGQWKIYESTLAGLESCGDCACTTLPILNEQNNASLNICNESNDDVTAADMESWEGDEFNLSDAVVPQASFYYTNEGTSYSSDLAANQTGSKIKITDVSFLQENFGKKTYKITGTITCKVATSGVVGDINITEGTFVVSFTED